MILMKTPTSELEPNVNDLRKMYIRALLLTFHTNQDKAWLLDQMNSLNYCLPCEYRIIHVLEADLIDIEAETARLARENAQAADKVDEDVDDLASIANDFVTLGVAIAQERGLPPASTTDAAVIGAQAFWDTLG